jgi:hypothetical protein
LERQLEGSQKERIRKIEQLLAGLSEQEVDYLRLKLLSPVETENIQ